MENEHMIFQVPATSEGNNPISFFVYVIARNINHPPTLASPFIGGGRRTPERQIVNLLCCSAVAIRVKMNGIGNEHRIRGIAKMN
jgi:hypothetical protein